LGRRTPTSGLRGEKASSQVSVQRNNVTDGEWPKQNAFLLEAVGADWSSNRMPMRLVGIPLLTVFLTAGLLCLGAAVASAQDPQQDTSQPRPAARTYPPIGSRDQDPNADQDSTPPLQPDTRPLTGVQESTLGSPELRHSYWVPGFEYSNSVSSTALNQTTGSNWNSTSFIAGSFSLLQAWRHSQLSVNYTGGGFLSTASSQGNGNGYFHQFGLTQAFKWRRWELVLLDQFSYLPEAAFGFGAGTGIAAPGIGGSLGTVLPGLQSNYQPNQSIFTSVGTRYTNSLTSQAAYAISRRSSINVAGSIGILRFLEAGNIDTNDVIFNAGYNYSLSKRDTIGVLYRFTADRYPGNPQAVNDHVVQAAYGRKITGRLALQLFGGPDVTNFRVPIGRATQQVGIAGGATLTYALSSNLNNISFSYNHGVSNGSGVQIGSSSDLVESQLSRRLSRYWLGNFNFGYARNNSLGNSDGGQDSQTFDSYFIGGDLNRPLGRSSKLSLGYTVQIQNSNQAVCSAGRCDTNYTSHRIFAALSWHARPLVLR
jgi:hypothetical protein